VPILLQKSFCTRDQNFFWLYTRLSCKYVGTSLPEDKLAGDLGNVIGPTSIGGRRSDFFTARKLAPGNLGLLQQYLPLADKVRCSIVRRRMPIAHIAHSNDFKVFFATSIKARSFGAKEARRG
jgi:hypothetical protein